MNGELMNMLQLTLTANHYIRTGEYAQQLTENKKIAGYIFHFAAQGEQEPGAGTVAESREQWLQELKNRGAQVCKVIVTDEVDDYAKLTTPNGLPCCILSFYNDGTVSSWNRLWRVNPFSGQWLVELFEQVIENAPADQPRFGDVSQDMVKLLERLRALAQKLELSEFSFRFHAAQKALQANFVAADGMMQPVHRRLLSAAIEAYVFDGGEDSWQKKGREAAEKKGMTETFEALTKELYRGIAYSCMYAVNEL